MICEIEYVSSDSDVGTPCGVSYLGPSSLRSRCRLFRSPRRFFGNKTLDRPSSICLLERIFAGSKENREMYFPSVDFSKIPRLKMELVPPRQNRSPLG